MLKKILRSKRGEGYLDVCILVLCAMLVIALAVRIFPVFVAKQQLDTFATELIREAEIAGRVGSETDRREQALREQTGLNPDISWSRTGRIQLNQEVAVTVTYETNIGLFSGFGSFPDVAFSFKHSAHILTRLKCPINGAFRFVVAYRCRINEHFNTGCGDFSPPKSCSYVCVIVKLSVLLLTLRANCYIITGI